MMNTEKVNKLELDYGSMHIDYPDMNPSLFYTTFDGKFSISLNVL